MNTYGIVKQENERFMGIPTELLNNKKYSAQTKMVFAALAYFDQEQGKNNPSITEIKEKSCVFSQQCISRAFKELENDGWIRVTYGGNGKGKTNTFEIFYDAMPTVLQYRRLKDGSIVTEQEYQEMLKQPKRATGFGRGKRR